MEKKVMRKKANVEGIGWQGESAWVMANGWDGKGGYIEL